MADDGELRALVAEVAAAYFSNTHVNANDIGSVITQISASLAAIGAPEPSVEEAPATEEVKKLTPAQIRKSISDNALTSFEDGRTYQTLKRHLSKRNMTPADYRTKWGLPADYPMTAPGYSARRSALAKELGLGKKAS